MTRTVRSGNSQKHKKMPGDATKWGEFDNQYASREIPSKEKKNVKPQAGSQRKFQSSVSNSHSSKHKGSLDDFFDEGKYCFTGNSSGEQENGSSSVTPFDIMSSSVTNEISSSNFTNNLKRNKKKKNQTSFNAKCSFFDEKNHEGDSDKVFTKHKKIKLENDLSNVTEEGKMFKQEDNLSDFTKNRKSTEESFNRHKKIKLENDLSNITEEGKMFKQEDNLSDFTKNRKSTEESFSQEPNKKRKKKKYNQVDSESLSVHEKTEEMYLSNNASFDNSNEISTSKQDVECMNSSDKIIELSKSYEVIDGSPKKQKLKKHDSKDNNSNVSPMKNESGKNSSSKVFENKKEKHLKRLQKRREKLGLILLPRNAECKLQKIKKRILEKGIPPEQQKEIMRQARRKEELKYRKVFNPSKLCFGCREPGHILADCPKKSETLKQETGICFKCGSVEHTSFKCSEKVQGFPFAKCFICKEQGHISRDCPQNKHGVYPKGGRCNLCGNVNHLKKDCPTLKKKENEEENITLHTLSEDASVDAELVKKEEILRKPTKKAKIVKF